MKTFLCLLTALTLFSAHAQLSPRTNSAPAEVTLAWSASTDPSVTGYNVYVGTASGFYTEVTNAGPAQSLQMTLHFGITYFFAATAYNAGGLESQFSNEVSYRPVQSSTNTPPSSPPVMKPVVVLSVQYKNSLQDPQWVKLFDFSPTNGHWFQLQAAALPPLAILKRR